MAAKRGLLGAVHGRAEMHYLPAEVLDQYWQPVSFTGGGVIVCSGGHNTRPAGLVFDICALEL